MYYLPAYLDDWWVFYTLLVLYGIACSIVILGNTHCYVALLWHCFEILVPHSPLIMPFSFCGHCLNVLVNVVILVVLFTISYLFHNVFLPNNLSPFSISSCSPPLPPLILPTLPLLSELPFAPLLLYSINPGPLHVWLHYMCVNSMKCW